MDQRGNSTLDVQHRKSAEPRSSASQPQFVSIADRVVVVLVVVLVMWLRKCGQGLRVYVPKGLEDLARGFNPGCDVNEWIALKGRKGWGRSALELRFFRPFRAVCDSDRYPGLKPRAKSSSPFGTMSRSDACPQNRSHITGAQRTRTTLDLRAGA
jgi:hypothetical protein